MRGPVCVGVTHDQPCVARIKALLLFALPIWLTYLIPLQRGGLEAGREVWKLVGRSGSWSKADVGACLLLYPQWFDISCLALEGCPRIVCWLTG